MTDVGGSAARLHHRGMWEQQVLPQSLPMTPTGSSAAGELLGWTPGALVGQRLTALIPAELREAHLAGFSRLQVTGKPPILGSMLHVPALRRDGSCVEIALTIEQLADHGGRSAFRAVLAATGEDARSRSSAG
ncbi:MAG TPA: PAS domain-containing protein [Acidimicrobiales bacterium]|nr:PAS domain-containing protein [Acidimicrobiales bacterium]